METTNKPENVSGINKNKMDCTWNTDCRLKETWKPGSSWLEFMMTGTEGSNKRRMQILTDKLQRIESTMQASYQVHLTRTAEVFSLQLERLVEAVKKVRARWLEGGDQEEILFYVSKLNDQKQRFEKFMKANVEVLPHDDPSNFKIKKLADSVLALS